MRTNALFAFLFLLAACGGSSNAIPSVSVTGPATNLKAGTGSLVAIDYTDGDPDDVATTDLLADIDGDPATGGDQYVIALARPEQDGVPQTVAWDTSGVPAGTYHVVAVTSDGRHVPVTATAPGTVTLIDTGMAIELLGDGGHVAFTNPLIGSRTTFTFEMWIKLSWPPVAGAPLPVRNAIYCESESGAGATRHFVFIAGVGAPNPGEVLGATTMTEYPPTTPPTVFTPPIPADEWRHLAFVRDGSALRIYLDGALAAAGSTVDYAGSTPNQFHLGLRVNPVSGNEWGKFVVDEVRASSVARYDADFVPEIVFQPDSDTLSLWHFDEAAGAATVDASGNAPDSTLTAEAMRVVADR